MNRYIVGAVIGIIATLILGHFYTSCKDSELRKENIDLKEQIVAMKENLERNEAISNEKIASMLESIATLQGNIDSLMFVNENLEEEIKDRESAVGSLQEEARMLKGEVQPVLDANPKVAALVSNLEGQVKEKDGIIFTLREQRANDQGIIFSLTEKYNAQVGISTEYAGQIEGLKALLGKVELRLNLQDRRVAFLERTATWKTVGLVGFGLLALAAIL